MSQVTRIVHRRANSGFEREYETLAKGMLEACSKSKGYLFSTLIPPRVAGEEFHIVQSFASQADLEAWGDSADAHVWHERIKPVADHGPEYRVFNVTDIWFSSTGLTAPAQPERWRMAFVTWMGIFPIASLYIWFLFPYLAHVPFIPRMAVLTALIVATMFYCALPYLLRWMGRFLRR